MTVTGVGAGFTLTFEAADPDAVDQLGGKGAGLARMTQQGLRVPPGYVTSTAACRSYLAEGRMPDGLEEELYAQLAALEERSGKTFGAGPLPLLLSVRSGAPVSMPGMMDTILDLGLSRDAAVAIATATGDTHFMAEIVARFHAMYAEIVLGALDPGTAADDIVAATAADDDPGQAYDRVWAACEAALADDTGDSVAADPAAQLIGAVEAVFRSWNTRRARTYREFNGIPHDLGTAVVVQAMVFGNLDANSGSGVVFTRNPVTGEPGLFGEYLARSQGEDVVAGIRTPDPVTTALAPDLLDELSATCRELERREGDVLDIEFTVERGTLWFLQVRRAKRTPEAAVRIAADLLAEDAVSQKTALGMVSAEQVRQVQRPGFDADEVAAARSDGRLLTTGIGACPGQVSGVLVLESDRAKAAADDGEKVVLARPVTSPADLHGMIAAQGIVTATGGSTSHAAVVARALGTACVVGASAMTVDLGSRTLRIGERTVAEGDPVSVDGATGEVFSGAFRTSTPASATGALSGLVDVARAAAGCAVFSRVTMPGDVAPGFVGGGPGLVTAVRGVLLAAAGDVELGVRAIDFLADEARELLQQTALTTQRPALAVPLGVPALIEGQLAGLARAVTDSGGVARVHLAVRHLSDPAEAIALRELAAAQGSGLTVGAYLTSPRAAFNVAGIAAVSDALWLEVRALQAAMFGIPARQMLTAEPLDDYVRRGLLSVDPRNAIDPSVVGMLAGVAAAADVVPGRRVGLRLTGQVSDEAAAQLYGLGFRRFAVDARETRPFLLALGKAALDGA
jgi:pyruvate,orthophosphate dikinase